MPSVTIEKVSPDDKNCKKHKVRVRPLTKEAFLKQRTLTFKTISQAKAFKQKVQKNFANGDYSFLKNTRNNVSCTVETVINDYIENPIFQTKVKESHKNLLKRVSNTSFGKAPVELLKPNDWYMLALEMNVHWNVKPQTTANYLSTLNSTLKDCATIFDLKMTKDSYSSGLSTAKRHGFIARSNERNRCPSPEEWHKITRALNEENIAKKHRFPLMDIIEFAAETAARIGEICGTKITWNDWDEKNQILTINRRKSPKKGTLNTSRFKPSPKAIEIITRQPRGDKGDPIFPYNPKTVGTAWRSLMKQLDITDLKFHDLRAEGICRMYNKGWSLAKISKTSGHRDLNVLNNFYLRLYPNNHY
ncbi:site-specific integrase [Vibrio vulnificus]|uniref:site-specific integrase n=1 Tax=Vibrio vulnificus TaxID=672 RepID=UPI00102A761E|nr:site-specific integrase [Vibrio vulnificus]EGQ7992636.1 site-specific integrase [Vibrio vulnificus]EIO3908894.1 site-specific integrase [Vibrio vulnificus]EJC6737460.1 site-specific integrase [Vibrio vulnificus]ELS0763346.1 site-specific integrase [Vibrio vulnificus]ELV8608217.1 site-specific integrase [Vibrio vulnificus]